MSDFKATVNVEVVDRAATLEVLDGGFQVVAQGFGSLEADLTPGLYKARASVGGAVQEQLFAVEEGVSPAPVRLDPVRFASPVPLNDTTTSHEYHQAAIAEALYEPPLMLGQGAGLLLSLRDPSQAPFNQTPQTLPTYVRSFEGFRLLDSAGKLLIDYDQAARRDPAYGYAVHNAELDPGDYILQYTRAGQQSVARPLPLAPGWATQVFILVEAQGEENLPMHPNFADCSVQMSPLGYNGYPSEVYFRMTEIARQSLLQGRNIVAREVMNTLLHDKFGNPLLGLLAAHLLLLDAAPRLNLLHIVLGNLGTMLGPDFPDIIALRVRIKQIEHPDQPPPVDQQAPFPPLLKASWDILARQTAQDDTFFPADSLCRHVADRVVDNGVWLAWRPLPPPTPLGGLLAGLSDDELQIKKWSDRERILDVYGRTEQGLDGSHLFKAVKTLGKPVLREKLRQFHKSAGLPTDTPEAIRDLLVRLAQNLPWEQIVARLGTLDEQGAITERLSSVQKSLIPAVLMLRQQLQAGQTLDKEQWERFVASLQVPRGVLIENLRDLARLAGSLATRFIEEGREKE